MNKSNVKFWVLGVLVVVLVVFFFSTRLSSQSVLSPPSTVSLQGGSVFWSAYVSVNDIKEGVGFNFAPSSTVLTSVVGSYPVGTNVTPKDGVIVYFSKADNFCTYQLVAVNRFNGIVNNAFTYYELQSPQRTFNVLVCADSDCKTVDATTPGNRLTFNANGGSLVVAPQGALVGKQDCPSNPNVALYIQKDGTPIFYNEAGLLDTYSHFTGFFTVFTNIDSFLSSHVSKSTFQSGFSSAPVVDSGRSYVKGSMNGNVSFGSGQILLTADAKFFASTFVVPPPVCNPKIDSLKVNDIVQGKSGTGNVVISVDTSCSLYLSAYTSRSSVTPSSTSLQVSSSSSVPFNIQCNVASGADSLTVKVCSGNDYVGNTNCISKSVSFNCLDSTSSSYCGDSRCDGGIGETAVTCSKDCSIAPVDIPVSVPLDCSKNIRWGGLIGSNPVIIDSTSCNLFGFNCKPVTKNTCSDDFTGLIVVSIIVIILAVGIFLYFKFKKPKRKK